MSNLRKAMNKKGKKKRVMVLGTGLVGGFVANKLYEEGFEVATCDIRENPKLDKNICQYQANLGDLDSIESIISSEKLIVNALPGRMAHTVLAICMQFGKKVVDFSFMEEDFLELDKLAKDNNGLAVCDFGFAPGICHMVTKRFEKKGDDYIKIFVGGLPENEDDEYKAVFSPRDIIEEYTRPARYVKNGHIEIETPFEHVYEWFGPGHTHTLAFISDGLRSLLKTTKLKNLVEYTLRYEKHWQKMDHLRQDGFFKPEHIENTAKVLIDKWKLGKYDKDISILQVKGYKDDKLTNKFSMYDKHDGTNHSMARATGLPVVAMVKLIAAGQFNKTGVFAPEHIAEKRNLYNYVIGYLKKNGVEIK